MKLSHLLSKPGVPANQVLVELAFLTLEGMLEGGRHAASAWTDGRPIHHCRGTPRRANRMGFQGLESASIPRIEHLYAMAAWTWIV